jgi:hypothetical protein
MVALLSGTFFSDKVRSAITMFLLTLLLGLACFQYFFPRHTNTLDAATIESLRDVRGQLERVADNLEKSSESQAALNSTLTRQLDVARQVQNEGYANLLKQYGLDLSLPSANTDDPFGLRTPDHNLGRELVPPSPGSTGTDQLLQDPAEVHKGKTDPSHPPGAERQSGTTQVVAGGPHDVSG